MLPSGKMIVSVSEKVLVESAEKLVTTCQYVGPKRPQHFNCQRHENLRSQLTVHLCPNG